jgi:hypothetical protein
MTRFRDKEDPQGSDTTDVNVTSPVEEWCPFRKGCEEGESWCSWPCDKWFEWHDAQVAAKERERVLDAIKVWREAKVQKGKSPEGCVMAWLEEDIMLLSLRQREQGK